METSQAFWKVFLATGHVGAYLLYKDYSDSEGEIAVEGCEKGKAFLQG